MKRWTKAQLSKYIYAPWLLPIVLLAAATRFFDLTKSAIWHDEGFSLMLSARGPAAIWAGSGRDVHPPLYYLLLHGWMNLFGNSIFAVRSMSAVAGIAVVVLVCWLTRLIATRRAAIIAGVLAAAMPILVRYSQEVRMYGILGVFMLGATVALIYYVQNPTKSGPLVLYAGLMTAAIYTHYFAFLGLLAHWIYLACLWNRRRHSIWHQYSLRPKWLLANVVVALLYLPWLPSLYGQLSRGQGVGWIPAVTRFTLPSAFWQFFTFTDGRNWPVIIYILLPLAVLAVAVYAVKKDHTDYKYSWLITLYTFLPIVLVLLVSLKKPLFIERYLVFAAAGLPIIVALVIDRLERRWRAVGYTLLVAALIVEGYGVHSVYQQANHQMNVVANVVNQSFSPGDIIISGELYTYFDFSYYNQTPYTPVLLYTPTNPDGSMNHPNGYGESGLLYQRASQIYLDSYRDIPTSVNRVWLVGKTGQHSYYDQVPYWWQLLGEQQAGDSEIRLYQIK